MRKTRNEETLNSLEQIARSLSDDELLFRLRNFEDAFVERKTEGDSKDWCKTVVGFANTTPIGYPAVLFIGVTDAGEIRPAVNFDTLQKTLGKELGRIYPPVYYLPKILAQNNNQFMAVIVPGSNERPHFAGQAFVRRGSETVEASAAQFSILIAERQSKVYEIRRWIGKHITLERRTKTQFSVKGQPSDAVLEECGQFFVTCSHPLGSDGSSRHFEAIPVSQVEISFDYTNKTLRLIVGPE